MKSLLSITKSLCFYKNRKIWLQFIMYSSRIWAEVPGHTGVAWCNDVCSAVSTCVFRAKAAEKSLSAASGKTARNTSDSFIHYAFDFEFVFRCCIKSFLTTMYRYKTPHRAAAHCLRSWGYSVWCRGRKCFLSPLLSTGRGCFGAIVLLGLPIS